MPNFSFDKSQSMANTSFALGLASVICLFFSMITLATAPLGIIMALLSRDESRKMNRTAKLGLFISLAAYAVAIYMIVSTLLLLANVAGGFDKFVELFLQQMENYMGTIA